MNLTNVGDQDAMHVACVLATTLQDLDAGEKVLFINDDLEQVISAENDWHGIVDPFGPGMCCAPGIIMIRPEYVSQMTHRFKLNLETPGYEPGSCSGRGC